jgi:hypothetical protein
MSQVYTPPIDQLAEFCRKVLGIETFVETGTCLGHSAAWAADRFARVITIEASDVLFERARQENYRDNIEFVLGDSRTALRGIIDCIAGPKLFWLDAHYCGGLTAGVDDPSPLVDELRQVAASPSDDVVLVDDFHGFALPLPAPLPAGSAPSLEDLFAAVRHFRPGRAVFVYHNVLVIACGRHAAPVTGLLHAEITRKYESALAGEPIERPWYEWELPRGPRPRRGLAAVRVAARRLFGG